MIASFRSSGALAADRRYLWAQASEKEGDLIAAAELYAQALELAPGWAEAWLALGRMRAALGEVDAAEAAFVKAEALDPADVLGAGLHRARLSRKGLAQRGPTEMPPAYVAGLFDAYADRFDAHLTGELGYTGPAIILAALGRLDPAQGAGTLDLGCGTGLMAEALRQTPAAFAGPIDGIDLSGQMLRLAQGRGLYRRLIQGDIVEATRALAATNRYRLVIAADVVVYLGDLAPLLAAVRDVLEPGGLFAFTAQALLGHDGAVAGFQLGEDLRFHHGEAYLRASAAAAGFTVRSLAAVSTRRDGGRDVPGYCIVLGTVDKLPG